MQKLIESQVKKKKENKPKAKKVEAEPSETKRINEDMSNNMISIPLKEEEPTAKVGNKRRRESSADEEKPQLKRKRHTES